MIHRPRLQFSLAAFLIAMTLAAVWVGRASREAHRQAILVAQVERQRGKLTYQARSSLFASLARPLLGLINSEYFRQVVGIDLRQKSAPAELLELIGGCHELRSLDLRGCRVGDDGVMWLSRLRRLESLDLSLNQITDASLPLIGQLSSLRHLELSENQVGGVGAEQLAKLPGLLSLCLDHTRLGDEAMPWIAQIISLQNLELAETRVTDEGLAYLHSLRRLTRLRLGGGEAITDRGLSQLRQLPMLSHLSLVEVRLSDKGLARLTQLKRLKYLNLENGEATYRLSAVADLQRLRPDLNVQQTVTRP